MLGAAEVAKLKDSTVRVEEKVLGLDVPVADAVGVDVGEGAEQLVHVKLDEHHGDGLLLLAVLSRNLQRVTTMRLHSSLHNEIHSLNDLRRSNNTIGLDFAQTVLFLK